MSLPGQEPGAEELSSFPGLDQLGLHLVTVLDILRVKQVSLGSQPLVEDDDIVTILIFSNIQT